MLGSNAFGWAYPGEGYAGALAEAVTTPSTARPSLVGIGHLLNTTAVVYRAVFTADAVGGRDKSMAVAGSIRAKVDQPPDVERAVAGRLGAELDYVVHAAYGVDVQRGDELDIGAPRRLRVVAVVTNSRATYTRLDCEVIESA